MTAKSIVVFGALGTLGQEVVKAAKQRSLKVKALSHDDCDISNRDSVVLADTPNKDSVWINCAGVLRPDQYGYPAYSVLGMIRANALGPHVLVNFQVPLIHISTDSVFSGQIGGSRAVFERPDANDLYGMTKAVGEKIAQHNHVTVLRTSFMSKGSGLMRQLFDCAEAGQPMEGFSRYYWSGSTVLEVARCIIDMIVEDRIPIGIQHLATTFPISKYRALELIKERYKLNVEIMKNEGPVSWRGLASTIPMHSFEEALTDYE